MAIRQYIGARYVPRFLGTYDATQQYEALDVVDNGSGTSYIARKNVPAGTPLTDTGYWFVYGASSGAIIQLQNDMIQAQNDIQELQDNKFGNLLIIGNSYVEMGCCADLKKYFDNSYQYTGAGYGFAPYAAHPLTFDDLLDTAIADSAFDNDTITDIIFVSAVGDCRAHTEDAAAYASNLNTVLSNIQTKIAANFTNVKRTVLTLAESRAIPYFANNKFSSLFAVHKIFKSTPAIYGIEYIGWSGFNNLFKAARFESDNFHPSAGGAIFISNWIKTAYFGNAEYQFIEYYKTGQSCKYTAASTVTLKGSFNPDQAQLSIGYINSTSGNPVTLGAGDQMFTTELANGAMPAPWITYEFSAKYIRVPNGVDADYLAVELKADSNGILRVVSVLAPTAATAAANNINAPVLNSISYNI